MDAIYILGILLVGAMLTYTVGDKWASKVALLFSLVAFGFTVCLGHCLTEERNLIWSWIESPSIHFALKIDGLAVAMLLLTTALIPLIIYSTFGKQVKNAKAFFALILLMAFAMSGTFLAADGILYYIFWELSLIPIYFIALLWGNGDLEERKKAVIKFFIYTFAGSLFMLAAFIYLYSKAGSLLIADLYALDLTGEEQCWIFAAFFLAYAIKIPLIPFHTWQANVYQKAPTVGTMLLSGIMLKMGLYSVIRWQLPIAPDASKEWMPFLLYLGIAGVIYGSIVAIRQKDLKKLLAYSSLAHVGLIAAGVYSLTFDGIQGAVLQMLAHGLVVVGLFFAAEVIHRRFETRKIDEMGGIRQQAPKFTSLFMILVLASVGLPLTFNFVGEFTVLYSLSQIDIIYAVLGGLTIILGAYYMLKMFQNVMLGETNAKPFADITMHEGVLLGIIAGAIFFFGLHAKCITDFITPSIQNILTHIN
ncbi:MAG: NADH-quinone oxidoreductase subunit M [Bacteroidota bacterium]